MSREIIRPEDIEKFLLVKLSEESRSGSSASDSEEEYVQHDRSSESEQSADEVDDVYSQTIEEQDENFRFYIGKDGKTIWMSQPPFPSTTQAKNIVKILPGPKMIARNAHKEIESFNLFITNEMIHDVVENTNEYIKNKRQDTKYSRNRDCKDTTNAEVKALFGTLYLLGINKAGHTNCCELWQTDGTGMTILRALFSYKRFSFLLRALRFDGLSTQKSRMKTDKLAPMRVFHQRFVDNCVANYNACEFVTIGEMLHPFRGRCGFVQYMPNKPARYGLKLYALCDAKTFYTLNFEIYCGKQMEGPFSNFNQPHDIVMRLIKPIEETKRNLTTDNDYGSYNLASYLLENGLTFLGTLKRNRKEIPEEFLAAGNRKAKSCLFGFQDEFCIVSEVTEKTKVVLMLSTMHGTAEMDPESNKPIIHVDYNKTKEGVAMVDQMCSAYSTARITRRWPLALFYRHLDIAGINAMIILKFNNPEYEHRRRMFLKNLAMGLMEDHLKERAKINSLPKDIQVLLERYKRDEVVQQEQVKEGICYICGKHKNNRTKNLCRECNKNVCKKHSVTISKCFNCGEHMEVD